jgi:transposase-like protein
MASVLKQPYFHDEAAAFVALEKIMWPNGQPDRCPHCDEPGRMGKLAVQTSKPSKRNPDGKPVHGLWKCYACRQQFTVRKGTVFEESRLELHLWFQAAFLMCSSKKGVSANQLHRTLGVTLKTAWFLAHRLREAMRDGSVPLPPMGGAGKYVEADETYIGQKSGHAKRRGVGHKRAVMTLVERGGRARSFHVKGNVTRKTAREVLFRNADLASHLMTDEASMYTVPGDYFEKHSVVTHSKEEYVRGEAHTNTVEGFFSVFKRGMIGTYQHCSEKHLHRYLAEFDFRYNNRVSLGMDDVSRTTQAISGAKGKRLTYR